MADFNDLLDYHAALITQKFDEILTLKVLHYEIERPKRLIDAMRHSTLNGGKRLRPFLVMESAALFGVSPNKTIMAAMALECIHCYSLVHDDLPAMDDDDLRRGQPTTHIAFDEATAILAGDALLTLAFDLLSGETTHEDANIRIELVQLFSRFAGLGGMVGGQMLDLEAETKSLKADEITTLQSMKTGALLRGACEAGAVLGAANAKDREALIQFGSQIGKAFQLADDILDITSDTHSMGKATGKDAGKGKGTLVDLYGLEKCQGLLNGYLEEALSALSGFDERADILRDTAKFIVERNH